VVLSDGVYRMRKRAHPFTEDAHGTPVAGVLGGAGPERPGARRLQPDGTYTLRLDPAEWQVRPGDVAQAPDGRSYVITGTPRLITNVAAGDVDFVSATAALDPPETP
jgi:hypothetical protein